MKHLLNGVAIAAALAIAAPVWAQGLPVPGGGHPPNIPPPSRPAAAAPAAAPAPAAGAPMAPMAGAPMAPMAGKQKHRRMHRAHMARGGKMGKMMSSGDMMTDQLNREELARIQGGAPPPPPPPNKAMQGPRPSGK